MTGISRAYNSFDRQVMLEGVNYVHRNRAGVPKYRSTYEELAIQDALDSLTSARTWKEKVKLKGEFPDLADTLTMDDYTILDLEEAKIKLGDSVNKDMIRNVDQTNGNANCKIKGGVIDANRTNNTTAGRGIEWIGNTIVGDVYLVIDGVWVVEAKNENIYIDTFPYKCVIKNSRIGWLTGGAGAYSRWGFYVHMCDGEIRNNYVSSGLYLYRSLASRIADNYFDVGHWTGENVLVEGCLHDQFIGNTFDSSQRDAVRLINGYYYCQGIRFLGNEFSYYSRVTANTYDGLVLEGNSHGNIADSNTFWNKIGVTATARDGIREKNSANYNLFANNVGRSLLGSLLTKIGANSVNDNNVTDAT